jgi:2'-5' RNA ligase
MDYFRKTRFNIALIPTSKTTAFVEAARSLNVDADYLLSDISLPHVTLAQFYLDKNSEAVICNGLRDVLYAFHMRTLDFIFDQFNVKSENEYFWVELLPHRNEHCYQFHEKIVKLLQHFNIKCINATLSEYVPHLTLARTRDLLIKNKILAKKANIADAFELCIGMSDEIGQLIQIKTNL